ncbi:hypothetical protein [Candidatus Ichthyocystis sparus]|uniref:hypothetical protein n=1 Tax=Candidatus Ichthyocystis sparus TaxID=1561004 RepID=UPI000B81A57B|nr:hypothetical protein [Candidatus Ichthyocystis sparus]
MPFLGIDSESVRVLGKLLLRFTRFDNYSYFVNVTRMVFKLLMAESVNYKSGLHLSFYRNKSNSVADYGELLENFTLFRGGVSDCQFYNMFHELLMARSEGVPGFMALQNGCEDSIKDFAKSVLLDQLFMLEGGVP